MAGGSRNKLPVPERKWGVNLGMPELLGAVMLVQLRKLDGLREAVRERMLKAGFEIMVGGSAEAIALNGTLEVKG